MKKEDKYKHTFTHRTPHARIKSTVNGHVNLTDICLAFEDYLKACGFNLTGYIGIIDEEESTVPNWKRNELEKKGI